MALKLYNTFSRKKQTFKPLARKVGLYTCGPTVYDFAHIGNLRTYIFEDILRRTLEYNNYEVRHVMNITDVGHLTSDADEGTDKLENKAKKEKKSVWEIAAFYTEAFLNDIEKLNIKKANVLVPATKTIKAQIAAVKKLINKGIAYETNQAIYFDVSKFNNYGRLSKQKLSQRISGARKEIFIDPQKRSQQDFALWFKITGRFKKHAMRWPSPWGDGFPGWHIECSTISTKYLGQPFDIHTGAVDNIFPHHENEIAQAEAAAGKKFANFWMHGEHLLVDGQKMAKSLGNFYTVSDIEKRNFNPLSFRYLVLTSHYRSKLNFTWQSLQAAQNALNNLYQAYITLVQDNKNNKTNLFNKSYRIYTKRFLSAINDDLNIPKALTVLWQVVKDKNLSSVLKKELILKFDSVFGLGMKNIKKIKIPLKIKKMAVEREKLRANQQFIQADALRKKIERLGYVVEDTVSGPIIRLKF